MTNKLVMTYISLRILLFITHICMFSVNIWLLTTYGIPDGCMRILSIWMICDAIEKFSRCCYGRPDLFEFIFSLGLYIWNVINLIMIDCDDIAAYYNYALAIIIYDTVLACVGIVFGFAMIKSLVSKYNNKNNIIIGEASYLYN